VTNLRTWRPVPKTPCLVQRKVSWGATEEHSDIHPQRKNRRVQNRGNALRRLILLVVLAALTYPAGAGARVTVPQLEHALTAAFTAHKPDAEIALQIATMELSEQLTEASLARLNARLALGAQTAQALALLADRSAFLDPPVAELPNTPAPDPVAQQRMIAAARNYVAQTLPRLPNFLATRTINRYDDSPHEFKKGDLPVRAGLHLVGTSSREISVREERENQPPTQSSAVWQRQAGLISGGEFGTTLGMVLTDTLQGTATWSHWEETSSGQAAVFRYTVPRSASHFQVIGTFQREAALQGVAAPDGGSRGTMGIAVLRSGSGSAGDATIRTRPGYHGSLWVDPASGTILRITIEADPKDSPTSKRASLLIVYEPVQIGGGTFICPVRSLALYDAVADVNASLSDRPIRWLNETLFTGYHHFASTTRIVADTPQTQPGNASELPQVTSTERNETASAIGKTTLPQSGLPPASSPLDSPTKSTPTASGPVVAAPAVTVPTVAPPAESTPAVFGARANEPQIAGITLQVSVNEVLVPVVVRDKQGGAVDGLKAEDFQVFDNDKPHAISAFNVERRGTPEPAQEGATASGEQPSAPATASPQPAALPELVVVFLFDDMHMGFEDLSYARKAGIGALIRTLSGSTVAAVVSTSGRVNSGLTRDPAKLHQAMLSLVPRPTDKSDCPLIDYYQADQMLNKHNAEANKDALAQVLNCDPGINPQTDLPVAGRLAEAAARRALALGAQDTQATLASAREIVRRMANLPGQRLLILVSPGFLAIEEESRTQESQLMDLAAQSNVTLSALDARGLYTTSLVASDDTHVVPVQSRSEFRASAMKANENLMAELAYGTGGTFFHNSNDLDAGFKALTQTPEIVYVLELSLDNVKPDGIYHRLKVKVNRDGLQLQARRGYFMPKAEKAKN